MSIYLDVVLRILVNDCALAASQPDLSISPGCFPSLKNIDRTENPHVKDGLFRNKFETPRERT
jgi:hypothetical protein